MNMPCEHEGRDQREAATERGMPMVAGKPLEARKVAGTDSHPQSSEEASPAVTLILDL